MNRIPRLEKEVNSLKTDLTDTEWEIKNWKHDYRKINTTKNGLEAEITKQKLTAETYQKGLTNLGVGDLME